MDFKMLSVYSLVVIIRPPAFHANVVVLLPYPTREMMLRPVASFAKDNALLFLVWPQAVSAFIVSPMNLYSASVPPLVVFGSHPVLRTLLSVPLPDLLLDGPLPWFFLRSVRKK
jgi:hypothetical protein